MKDFLDAMLAAAAIIAVMALVLMALSPVEKEEPFMDPTIDPWAGLSTPSPALSARALAARERASRLALAQYLETDRRAHDCLALNVYHEARGEPMAGMLAVAEVTLTRADGKPGRVCAEVFRPHQFSWTLSEARRAVRPHPTLNPAYRRAVEAARLVLDGGAPSVVPGATHFHSGIRLPYWAKQMTLLAVIGGHKFYSSEAA